MSVSENAERVREAILYWAHVDGHVGPGADKPILRLIDAIVQEVDEIAGERDRARLALMCECEGSAWTEGERAPACIAINLNPESCGIHAGLGECPCDRDAIRAAVTREMRDA